MTNANRESSDAQEGMLTSLTALMSSEPDLDFAMLIGSRASGMAHTGSDWDIALQWAQPVDWLSTLSRTESLRERISLALKVPNSEIDLIDLRRANLAMRASVAEEGIPLAGEDSVAWARFLRRTWRELEDFYWDKKHAA